MSALYNMEGRSGETRVTPPNAEIAGCGDTTFRAKGVLIPRYSRPTSGCVFHLGPCPPSCTRFQAQPPPEGVLIPRYSRPTSGCVFHLGPCPPSCIRFYVQPSSGVIPAHPSSVSGCVIHLGPCPPSCMCLQAHRRPPGDLIPPHPRPVSGCVLHLRQCPPSCICFQSHRAPSGNRWVKVEWNSGGCSVVNVRYLMKSLSAGEELKVGVAVTIGKKPDGTPLTATVLASSHDRQKLVAPIFKEDTEKQPAAGTSEQREDGDFSPSASDWEPSDNGSSEESDEEEECKKSKLDSSKIRQYPNKSGRKVLVPTNRPNPIIPNGMHQLALQNLNRKRNNDMIKNGMNLKRELSIALKQNGSKPEVSYDLLRDMNSLFKELFQAYSIIHPEFDTTNIPQVTVIEGIDRSVNNTLEIVDKNETVKSNGRAEEKSASEYSDRSDDNVLITNKYDTVNKTPMKPEQGEWVSIGTGTTLIHKDKFRRVNWKSYTIATRTLLLAAFPRRTLATHSLTGKKSPAFINKPAKMCLDPKIVSDIVIEITDKFKVKENLVRSIITTKCADECKMLKMKANKKIKAKTAKNQENIPPPAAGNTNTS